MAAIKKSPSDEMRLKGVESTLKSIVLGSVRVKSHVVSADEKEGGLRNLLNFGHSIGHAFEGILAPQILHGECVSIGMVLEAKLARYLGKLSGPAVGRLTKCLKNYGLPVSYKDPIVQQRSHRKPCPVDQLLSIMAVDKKNQGRQKRIVLLSTIGRTFEKAATGVSDRDLRVILSSGVAVRPLSLTQTSKQCTPPGSKSISNRALILAALGEGTCRIRNLLHSDDTEVMMKALSELQCASFEWEDDGEVLVVKGNGGRMQASSNPLYLGNAGTASRFLTSVATLAQGSPGVAYSTLDGNKRMRERPQGHLVEALRVNGAKIKYMRKEGSFPLEIDASGGLGGGEIGVEASISSQFISSLLLSSPYAKKPVTLRLTGEPVSMLYTEMTVAMMKSFGITVTRSSTDPYTYEIPQGRYQNPPAYEVESDASSATYPLAIAAITGSTCRVPNIGSASLQGDARFAVDVLRPMGCMVEQTETSTTVTGPAKGSLKPIPHVDMEPMTDAFLTASVLAAVAKGSHPTRITGIANQEVKECARITVMLDELAKFGVTCQKIEEDGKTNGIEVNGIEIEKLEKPSRGVCCYDDHRVAMSFSVLALAATQPTLIQERECVGKTWPGWWDELAQNFGAQLDGVDLETHAQGKIESNKSIFIIGMRGAGKTTAGKWAADILGWPCIDLDQRLEQEIGRPIKEFLAEDLDAFRRKEIEVLKRTMAGDPRKHIFACGGGIVEIPEARSLLMNYHKSGGPVLLVHRDIEAIIAYLSADITRPTLPQEPRALWERRKSWYAECSNYEYFSRSSGTKSLAEASIDFAHLLNGITGRHDALKKLESKERSFFLAITAGDVSSITGQLREMVVGSDALELRVDLLSDPDNELPSAEYVRKQCSTIRGLVQVPIIFTIRSVGQGGKFPESPKGVQRAGELLRLALRMGVEFLDLEISLSDEFLQSIVDIKGHTKIIASHHDPQSQLRWNDGSWVRYYNRALQYGDIVKLIGVAHSQADNEDVATFRKWVSSSHSTPIIALNMGAEGQLSRIQNSFLSPVTHPLLNLKAAPGQLSAKQIRQALSLHGVIKPLNFHLFGTPISASRSPYLHNTLFADHGLPHQYSRYETSTVEVLEPVLEDPAFGGASVTIPHKLSIRRYLDEENEAARVIGAVNTIVVDHSRSSTHGSGFHCTGHNTDWMGIVDVLENAGAQHPFGSRAIPGRAGLVVGTGGTSRAAVYALHQMGCQSIWLLGRTAPKVKELVESFPEKYNLKPLPSDAKSIPTSAKFELAIGTIPASGPMDEGMRHVLTKILPASRGTGTLTGQTQQGDLEEGEEEQQQQQRPRILLDMSYTPPVTPLMHLAQNAGWKTVPGLQVLAAQGVHQFELWTGIRPTAARAQVS
ncbi:MAG: hypothetical protein LQ340_006229 [Diploschistes diacapsis]|nr:MAG: hypothetical protein LQ340_006229 [Diploschistes diacapsis]